MTDHVYVYMDAETGTSRLVGEVFFTARAGRLVSSTFRYSTDYLASAAAFAIDPALSLHAGAQNVGGLPGALQDCSPDRWGRNLIIKRARAAARVEHGPRAALTDADFLLGVSDVTRQGALRFRAETGGEFLATGGNVPNLADSVRRSAAST